RLPHPCPSPEFRLCRARILRPPTVGGGTFPADGLCHDRGTHCHLVARRLGGPGGHSGCVCHYHFAPTSPSALGPGRGRTALRRLRCPIALLALRQPG